jgi:hypothetical protein
LVFRFNFFNFELQSTFMQKKDIYVELSSIRNLMERSSKFISLSGLSGVLAGCYALAGAGWAYGLITNTSSPGSGEFYMNKPLLFWQLFAIALSVLLLSVLTSYRLTIRRAKSKNENVWNPVSRRLLTAVSFPLFTGGLFIMIMLLKGDYTVIAAACLIFYGLALIAGSQYTYNEVKWLGLCQIVLGLLALVLPGNGLILWSVGFGLLHILYGSIMHFKYER